ncbi:DUF262 domain-containing protein [bacterium]|nr:DUF262 domain-containing protein [bacterium]MBP5591584.1 DUF262 domain-containing protein [bacterium]
MSQNNNDLPLQELSINKLFCEESRTYEIPIYQRNYAWGKDEIETLVQDVYDSFTKQKENYYIGTLVTFRKDNNLFEVIDGQQRLTTIYLILKALNEKPKSKLTYKARPKSDKTLNALPDFKDIEEKDQGIVNGFNWAKNALKDKTDLKDYFLNKVHIIHYQVPHDIDLNHYFEVMNSRGEQLEKHEIVKARLMGKLDNGNDDARMIFNKIWEACSQMSTYVQRNLSEVFNDKPDKFELSDFDSLKIENNEQRGSKSIEKILSEESLKTLKKEEKSDTFQPIIDFPNFLLIVLKITRMLDENDQETKVTLDDKELLSEFDKAKFDADKVKTFAFNLLKARFFLDNYIVHHSNEDDIYGNNPWKLQVLTKKDKETTPENLCSDNKELQEKLVHLLSMFEVSYTAKQYKNYLFDCLYWLMKDDLKNVSSYADFVENLASKYFKTSAKDFENPARIPLFVFNYLDYKIWKLYAEQLKGQESEKGDSKRRPFFEQLGCSDFGLDIFQKFYFSRTRRSLEHYFPQANANKEGAPNDKQINCFGNFAMIGAEANSSGSNWSPKAKLDHYLDPSGKINQISVASLKFMIMMQICKDHKKWERKEIQEHQSKMLAILGLTEEKVGC